MERSVEVDTGESVAFRYDLAGLGSRFLAVLVDMAIQLGVVIAIVLFFLIVATTLGPRAAVIPAKLRSVSGSVIEAMFVLAGFLLFFGYFILFEWLWQGRTPGKRVVGIRVLRDGGFALDFMGSATRNIVRILEVGIGFYLVSAISTLLSPLNRRLGDYAAGTIVVRDARYERTPFSAMTRDDDPVMRDVGLPERELIRKYVERRTSLAPEARSQLAAHIAALVRPNLAAPFDHLDDDALLEHLGSLRAANA
jgi:uncharacterized RDD family membrane protein YckC